MFELSQDRDGYHEVTEKGIDDRNILFRNGKIGSAERESLCSLLSLGLPRRFIFASIQKVGDHAGGICAFPARR
jgi:hypothetical protein